MKIIIVDDEMSALHAFLNDVIDEKDIEYKFFKDNGEEIEEYVSANRVEAAFLDINMPGVNGLALAEKLIGIRGELRIVFITGQKVGLSDLPEPLRTHTVGFIYKPYDKETLDSYFSVLRKLAPALTVKMFGSFDCFINGNLVRFTSKKSKELFALLLAYNGKSLSMTDAISQLWPDTPLEKSKKLYRDAVCKLRKVLKEICFACVRFGRALLVLNSENISCDYWDFLKSGRGDYNGEFLKSYDWSVNYLAELDKLRQ